MNEQTKNILMLEKEPSSYLEDSVEPSERQVKDLHYRKKIVKNVSNLNKSFDEMETKKKPEEPKKTREDWVNNLRANPVIGYFYVFIKNCGEIDYIFYKKCFGTSMLIRD